MVVEYQYGFYHSESISITLLFLTLRFFYECRELHTSDLVASLASHMHRYVFILDSLHEL